jgi:S1-C subfamily serine protease
MITARLIPNLIAWRRSLVGGKVLGRCTACGLAFDGPEKYAGKTVACPKCKAPVVMPGAPAADAPSHASSNSNLASAKPPAKPAIKRPAETSHETPSTITSVLAKPAPPAARAPARGGGEKAGGTEKTSVAPRGRKTGTGLNPLVALAAGGGLVLVLVVVSAAYFISGLLMNLDTEVASSHAGEGAADSQKDSTPNKAEGQSDTAKPDAQSSSWNVFVLDISDRERDEVQVTIDGLPRKIPNLGPVSFELPAGSHQLQLTRPGFEPIGHSFTLANSAIERFTPQWQRPGAGPVTPPTTGGGQLSFADWLQDFEAAKRRAQAEGKDILVSFNGTDWSGWCVRLMYEVLFQREFRDRIEHDFVLVHIDTPRQAAARGKVENAARNAALVERFGVSGFPTVFLTDSQGQVYAETGYVEGGVAPFLAEVNKLRERRGVRDRLFAAVDAAQGQERIKAAEEAVAWLEENDVAQHYGTKLAAWLTLALEQDPNNEQGQLEVFFEIDWYARIANADRADLSVMKPILNRLTNFNNNHKFRDGDRGARLNLIAASFCKLHDDLAAAKTFADAGLACGPQDEELLATLTAATRALASGDILGSGTGFVIAGGGYILTNHHVIEGDGKPFVRIAGKEQPAQAKIVAVDKQLDIALLQVNDPQLVPLTPLSINTFELGRGADVAVFGYPLGDDIGTGLKLTTGIVSALPDAANDGMVLLDCTVNPGNSGGPLCDAGGRVIGMVTAKTGGFGVDSYGMARPADKLEPFLKRHIPGYAGAPAAEPPDTPAWGKIDRAVSGSVLMIVMKK